MPAQSGHPQLLALAAAALTAAALTAALATTFAASNAPHTVLTMQAYTRSN